MQYHKNTGNVQGFPGGKGKGKRKRTGEKNIIHTVTDSQLLLLHCR